MAAHAMTNHSDTGRFTRENSKQDLNFVKKNKKIVGMKPTISAMSTNCRWIAKPLEMK